MVLQLALSTRKKMSSTTMDGDAVDVGKAHLTSATLTIRLIKSFEYRTVKNLILNQVNVTTCTVGQLKSLIEESRSMHQAFISRNQSDLWIQAVSQS